MASLKSNHCLCQLLAESRVFGFSWLRLVALTLLCLLIMPICANSEESPGSRGADSQSQPGRHNRFQGAILHRNRHQEAPPVTSIRAHHGFSDVHASTLWRAATAHPNDTFTLVLAPGEVEFEQKVQLALELVDEDHSLSHHYKEIQDRLAQAQAQLLKEGVDHDREQALMTEVNTLKSRLARAKYGLIDLAKSRAPNAATEFALDVSPFRRTFQPGQHEEMQKFVQQETGPHGHYKLREVQHSRQPVPKQHGWPKLSAPAVMGVAATAALAVATALLLDNEDSPDSNLELLANDPRPAPVESSR